VRSEGGPSAERDEARPRAWSDEMGPDE